MDAAARGTEVYTSAHGIHTAEGASPSRDRTDADERNVKQKLNRLWRIFATGLVFAVFGLGSVLISVTAFPLLRLAYSNAELARRGIQHGMQKSFKFYIELMRVLGIMTYEVRGVERLRQGGRLIVANHPTLIDVVMLVSLMPEVDCIVKQGLWRNPFLRWPVLWASYIPNSESEELIAVCAARVRQGHSLLVFPEGTRSTPGEPMRMQRGAAHIALAADAEVLPVTITCEPITLYKRNPWYRVPERRFHLSVDVGSPVAAGEFRRPEEMTSRAARRLTQWLLDYYGPAANDGAQNAARRVKSQQPESRASALH